MLKAKKASTNKFITIGRVLSITQVTIGQLLVAVMRDYTDSELIHPKGSVQSNIVYINRDYIPAYGDYGFPKNIAYY